MIKRFQKLLVANRGEIAIRVLRAASELSLRTVAMYTYEDRYSLHRYKADEAYQIGPNDEPLKPYLDIEVIIKMAKENDPWLVASELKQSATLNQSIAANSIECMKDHFHNYL